MRRRSAVVLAVSGGVLVALLMPTPVGAGGDAKSKAADVPVPTVTGPITGGNGTAILVTTGAPVFEAAGYEAEEYFIEGEASSYTPVGTLERDGRWEVEPGTTAPYKTRIVVYRPADADDFNGTVFVEWFNVTAGFDVAPDWNATHTYITRSGGAFVGVSAQAVGVQGGTRAIGGAASGGIKAGDPARYGSLSHPGDEYSFDMFSQAGVVASGKAELDPLDGLDVERVIAMGESQSAFRMVSYTNAVHPLAQVFDGYLIHSRGASGTGFGADRRAGVPESVITRTDLDVPVITVQTEGDLLGLGSIAARQRDSKRFRMWEIAGTAHADRYTAGLSFGDTGDGSAERSLLDPAQANGGPLGCGEPINSGPAFAVVSAALFQLERWVRTGKAAPRSPRLEVTDAPEPELARDERGNALGGIRTGFVDAPIARLTGEPNAGGDLCGLFGRTVPFDEATLAELYPTHDDYVEQFEASNDAAVDDGFLLRENADAFNDAARDLDVP